MTAPAVNVGALLSRHAGRRLAAIVDLSRPDAPREIGYAELDAAANGVAGGLAARGLGTGDRVGILALNCPEYVETLFGAMRAGCVPVPLNVKLPAETLAFIARDAGLALLFVDAAHRGVWPRGIPLVDYDDGYADFLKPGPFTPTTPGRTDLCVQPYTSGSTGRPKGVLLAHAGQAWQIETLVAARRLTREDKGQVPVAFVVPRPGATLTERAVTTTRTRSSGPRSPSRRARRSCSRASQAAVVPVDHALKEWALARGAAYQHPRRVFFVDELPLAGTNKLDLAALKARVAAATRPRPITSFTRRSAP